jgi:hypothetical protein
MFIPQVVDPTSGCTGRFVPVSLLRQVTLSPSEGQEAAGLVKLAEFLSLLRLRSTRVMQQS